MDEPLAALLAKLYMADKRRGQSAKSLAQDDLKAGGEGFKDDKQVEEGVALLFEPWLDTGLAGYLGMQPLCWCWDQVRVSFLRQHLKTVAVLPQGMAHPPSPLHRPGPQAFRFISFLFPQVRSACSGAAEMQYMGGLRVR